MSQGLQASSMNVTQTTEKVDTTTWTLKSLEQEQHTDVQGALAELHFSKVAQLLESVPPSRRNALIALLADELASAVIPVLAKEVSAQLLKEMPATQIR